MDSFGIASCNFGVLVVSEFVDLMALLSMLKPSQPKARKVYDNCSRSVVKISTVRLAWDERLQMEVQVSACGSGIVWDRDLGLLVTCDHVIRDVLEMSITLKDESDGKTYEAEVVFSDSERDIAVLRVEDAPKDKLWPVAAGDSDTVAVGDEVYAIGTPFGFENSLSTGVISGVKREVHPRGRRPIQGLLQTNAALNPGNSGGPLLDIHGKVIGMNTCINASQSGTSTGVGFATPVNVISEIIDKTVKVKPANNTKPNSGIELLPYHSGESHIDNVDFVNGSCVGAKLKHRHSHRNHDYVFRYISRGVSGLWEEGIRILNDLKESGQARMRNGDVIVCRGYCEECQKMDLDVLPSDHVDRFGVGRTHPSGLDSTERWFVWRRQLRFHWAWLYSFIDTRNDNYDKRWETSEENGPSYQFRSISRNKSVPYRSVDQLHTVNDQVERYGKVKRPILINKFAPFGSFERFDASPLLDLYHLSPTNDPSGKVDLRESQLLEELLKSFICCCPATSSRKPVSCTQAGTNKSSNPGSSGIKCC